MAELRDIGGRRTLRQELVRHHLLEKCRLLETGDSRDKNLRALAEEAWNKDFSEADRLGAVDLKNRLEDAALRILNPAVFEQLRRNLAEAVGSHKKWIKTIKATLEKTLADHGVPCLSIDHRVKNVGGTFRKMQMKGLTLQEINDLIALRVIVPSQEACYSALDAVHHAFEHRLLGLKDYIADPKPNGYESLHTSIAGEDGPSFEVQIRSRDMHLRARRGEAAHWRYKAQGSRPARDSKRLFAKWRLFTLFGGLGRQQ